MYKVSNTSHIQKLENSVHGSSPNSGCIQHSTGKKISIIAKQKEQALMRVGKKTVAVLEGIRRTGSSQGANSKEN